MRFVLAAVLVCLFTVPTRAEAQEGQKWEGVTWYRIVNVDYYNGKAGDARDIINDHYLAAAEKAGTPAPDMLLWNETGEWDLTIVWTMLDLFHLVDPASSRSLIGFSSSHAVCERKTDRGNSSRCSLAISVSI